MEAYALTDTGSVRNMNQDYIYSSPEKVGSLPNLFLVADGMGGHKAGDYASRYAVENLVVYLNRSCQGGPVIQLKDGIRQVNEGLFEESRSREELRGMGCTLVAAVVEDNTLYVANIGDSRLYLIQGGSIRQVTKDHSYVEEMVAMARCAAAAQITTAIKISSQGLWALEEMWSRISLKQSWKMGIISCCAQTGSAIWWTMRPSAASSQAGAA